MSLERYEKIVHKLKLFLMTRRLLQYERWNKSQRTHTTCVSEVPMYNEVHNFHSREWLDDYFSLSDRSRYMTNEITCADEELASISEFQNKDFSV